MTTESTEKINVNSAVIKSWAYNTSNGSFLFRKTVVLYEIEAVLTKASPSSQSTILVKKRYSEFNKLRKSIINKNSSVEIFPFPNKGFNFFCSTSVWISSRIKKLNEFLTHLIVLDPQPSELGINFQ
jgi:hypothetical protein